MKTGQKFLLGVGVTAIVAATGAYLAADALVDKLQRYRNRSRVKAYVKDNLNGNQRLLDFVDRLTDDDIDHLLEVAHKFGDVRERVGRYSGPVKDTANELRDLLTEYAAKIRRH